MGGGAKGGKPPLSGETRARQKKWKKITRKNPPVYPAALLFSSRKTVALCRATPSRVDSPLFLLRVVLLLFLPLSPLSPLLLTAARHPASFVSKLFFFIFLRRPDFYRTSGDARARNIAAFRELRFYATLRSAVTVPRCEKQRKTQARVKTTGKTGKFTQCRFLRFCIFFFC